MLEEIREFTVRLESELNATQSAQSSSSQSSPNSKLLSSGARALTDLRFADTQLLSDSDLSALRASLLPRTPNFGPRTRARGGKSVIEGLGKDVRSLEVR